MVYAVLYGGWNGVLALNARSTDQEIMYERLFQVFDADEQTIDRAAYALTEGIREELSTFFTFVQAVGEQYRQGAIGSETYEIATSVAQRMLDENIAALFARVEEVYGKQYSDAAMAYVDMEAIKAGLAEEYPQPTPQRQGFGMV